VRVFEPQHAPLNSDGAPASTRDVEGFKDLAGAREALKNTARDIQELVVDDEVQTFHIGVRRDAPFEYTSLLGVSFERRRGRYDREMRSWTFEPGRVIELSPRLASLLQIRSSEVWLQCEIREDNLGREFAARIRKRVDLRAKKNDLERDRALRSIKRTVCEYNAVTQKKTHEWFTLERFLILQKKDQQALTSYDQYVAEKRSWQNENDKLRTELEEMRVLNDSDKRG
jgi:hypothetical protein